MTTTWNPSDVGTPGVVFSNTNHTVTSTAIANVSVRGTTSHTTGQWYFEITALNFNGAAQGLLGFADSTAVLNTNSFSGASGVGISGSLTNNGGPGMAMPSAPDAAGITTVCFAINFDTELYWVRYDNGNWNGSGTASPVTGVGGAAITSQIAQFPFFFMHNSGVTCTINCGDTSFNQTPPSGYSAWQGTQSYNLHVTKSVSNNMTGATTGTVSYTTTEADQIVVLLISHEPNNATTNKTVTGVTDTNSLTWTKRWIKTYTNASPNTLQNLELWWAHSTVAQTGTITATWSAAPDDTVLAAISVSGVQNLSAPFDTNGGLPAQATNTTTTATNPSVSASTSSSGAVLVLTMLGWPHSGTASGIGDASKDRLLINVNNSGGAQWDELSISAAVHPTALSSTSKSFAGTYGGWQIVVDAITGDAGAAGGTWASTDTKDTFAALGSVNDAGEWHSTEAKDTFSGAGTGILGGPWASTDAKDTFTAAGGIPDIGTWASTDAKDAFAAAGVVPPVGSMSATDHGDSWATSSGWDALAIDTTSPANTNVGGTFNITTNGPDRIIVLCFASVGTSGQTSSITSISGSLNWQQLDDAVSVLPGAFGDGIGLQVLWAYAHNKLNNEAFVVSTTGGALLHMQAWLAVKGLNGNFNNPWAPAGGAYGPSFGADGPNALDTLKTPEIDPWGTGTNPTTAEYYPSVLLAFGMNHGVGTNTALAINPPFADVVVDTGNVVGSQRQGRLNMGAFVDQDSFPWRTSDNLNNRGIGWYPQQQGFLVIADAMAANPAPNRFIAMENADTMSGHGYVGSSAGPIGQFNPTETPDTFSAHGFQPASGRLTAFEATDKFSAYISVPITGHFALTEKTDKFTATGLGRGEDGTFIVNESVDTFQASGYTPVSGTFNTTGTPDKARFVGAGVVNQRKRRTFYVT